MDHHEVVVYSDCCAGTWGHHKILWIPCSHYTSNAEVRVASNCLPHGSGPPHQLRCFHHTTCTPLMKTVCSWKSPSDWKWPSKITSYVAASSEAAAFHMHGRKCNLLRKLAFAHTHGNAQEEHAMKREYSYEACGNNVHVQWSSLPPHYWHLSAYEAWQLVWHATNCIIKGQFHLEKYIA